MKRLVLFFALLLLPVAVFAQTDRDILLTPNGTVYTIESELAANASDVNTPSFKILHLTVQNGDVSNSYYVPGSLDGGIHSNPSLAYDADTDRLFVFWQRQPSLMESELLFCSFSNGTWSDVTSIENVIFHYRFNLRIGVSRFVADTDGNGNVITRPGLVVHAIWWDQTGEGESARYAMIPIANGEPVNIQIFTLLDFVPKDQLGDPTAVPDDFPRDFFRNPAIFELPARDGVEVVFANWNTNNFHQVDIRPIHGTGVLTVPIGIHRGRFAAPNSLHSLSAGRVSVVPSRDGERFGFYYHDGSAMNYMVYDNGTWGDIHSVTLSDKVPVETAVEALRRLLNAD